jgi:hypothetical protein
MAEWPRLYSAIVLLGEWFERRMILCQKKIQAVNFKEQSGLGYIELA